MRRAVALTYLIGLMILLWPAQSWAAAPTQTGDPTPTPTDYPVSLTLASILTEPTDVVLFEPFTLIFSIRSDTPYVIEDLSVTYRDTDEDRVLVAVTNTKTDSLPIPGYLEMTISKGLRYLADQPGVRQIEVIFAYTYRFEGQAVARTQTESIIFRTIVATPTPTATPTLTPTPTSTPTATLTPTPTATPTPSPTIVVSLNPVPESVAPANPSQPSSPAPGPTSDPIGPASNESDRAADGNAVKDNVLLFGEFQGLPAVVQPGATLLITLTVVNANPFTVTRGIVVWSDSNQDYLVPLGAGTEWPLEDIPPGGKGIVPAKRFYVPRKATPGLQGIQITVKYDESKDSPPVQSYASDIEASFLIGSEAEPTGTPTPLFPRPKPSATPTIPPEPSTTESFWLQLLRFLIGLNQPKQHP